MRANARPACRAAPSPNLYNSAVVGRERHPSTGAQSAKRASTQRSDGNGGAWSAIKPGQLAGRRAANRGRAPAANLAPLLLASRPPTRASAETTLHGCGRHKRCRCPPARLSSAHAEPTQPLAPRLPSPHQGCNGLAARLGPCTRKRTGRSRSDPARSHAGPRQGHSASLRRVAAGPASRKHPAPAASW
jgi:hypothetical protein